MRSPSCEAVASLANSLEMATIAEGVETERQLEMVRSLGCTEMQGFVFSPPRPASEIARLLVSTSERRRQRGVRVTLVLRMSLSATGIRPASSAGQAFAVDRAQSAHAPPCARRTRHNSPRASGEPDTGSNGPA